MIRFFRTLRQRLLAENRLSKYLLYALGEIALVMIGILLALQVNTWSEARDTAARMDRILNEIRLNLLQDIEESNIYLEGGRQMDSLCQLVLDGKLEEAQYRDPAQRHLFYVGLQYQPFEYQTAGFDKLLNFQGSLPPAYYSVLTKVNFYYNNLGGLYNSTYAQLREQIRDRHNYLAQHQDWYYLVRKKEVTDAMVDFYLNDPMYRNWVSQHRADNTSGKQGTMWYLHQGALRLTAIIEQSLQLEPSLVVSTLYGPPDAEIQDYLGKYDQGSGIIVSLSNYGGHLFAEYGGYSIILTRKDPDTYISPWDRDEVVKFQRDDAGKVTGIHFISSKDSTLLRTATKN